MDRGLSALSEAKGIVERKQAIQRSHVLETGMESEFGWVRDAANTIATERSIPATDTDVRGAAALYYLACISKSGELDGSEGLAQEVFALMRDEPLHIVVYRNWIEAVLARGKMATADEHSVAYLEFLKKGGRGNESVQNSIVFWA